MYKGKLKTGEEVAVKVQRPYVLETVTVDLFIIRSVFRTTTHIAFEWTAESEVLLSLKESGNPLNLETGTGNRKIWDTLHTEFETLAS